MKQEVVTVGLDLAKSVFQVHAIGRDGAVLVRRAYVDMSICRYVDMSTHRHVCQPIGVYIRSVSQTPRVKPHHRTSC